MNLPYSDLGRHNLALSETKIPFPLHILFFFRVQYHKSIVRALLQKYLTWPFYAYPYSQAQSSRKKKQLFKPPSLVFYSESTKSTTAALHPRELHEQKHSKCGLDATVVQRRFCFHIHPFMRSRGAVWNESWPLPWIKVGRATQDQQALPLQQIGEIQLKKTPQILQYYSVMQLEL